MRDGSLELKRRDSAETLVNNGWVTRTRLVAEGLSAEPYLHLDIRTPFGELVDDGQVDQALAESLGPRKERFAKAGWHIQFVEDTNLGSNHRIFVGLRDLEAGKPLQNRMDAALPLEVAVEALAEAVLTRHGEPNFQLVVSGPGECWSALYVNGSPFHLLRIREGTGEKAAVRLARHREYAGSLGKSGPFRLFLCPGDPLGSCESLSRLQPETMDFKLRLPEVDAGTGKLDTTLHLHLGLALAASRREFAEHNRVESSERQRNQGVRGRARFGMALLATTLVCLFAAGAYALGIRQARTATEALRTQAGAYQEQVEAIRALRFEKARLTGELTGLKPVWNGPIAWGDLFADLSAALPAQAGIDGLTIDRGDDGRFSLSFRAWVKDWDAVRGIERKLNESQFLETISISEQRKDQATGAVVFHVSSKLEGR